MTSGALCDFMPVAAFAWPGSCRTKRRWACVRLISTRFEATARLEGTAGDFGLGDGFLLVDRADVGMLPHVVLFELRRTKGSDGIYESMGLPDGVICDAPYFVI